MMGVFFFIAHEKGFKFHAETPCWRIFLFYYIKCSQPVVESIVLIPNTAPVIAPKLQPPRTSYQFPVRIGSSICQLFSRFIINVGSYPLYILFYNLLK